MRVFPSFLISGAKLVKIFDTTKYFDKNFQNNFQTLAKHSGTVLPQTLGDGSSCLTRCAVSGNSQTKKNRPQVFEGKPVAGLKELNRSLKPTKPTVTRSLLERLKCLKCLFHFSSTAQNKATHTSLHVPYI